MSLCLHTVLLQLYCLYMLLFVFSIAHTPKRSPLPPEPSPITPLGDGHPIKQGKNDENIIV